MILDVAFRPVDELEVALPSLYTCSFVQINRPKDLDDLLCVLTPISKSEPFRMNTGRTFGTNGTSPA